MYNLFDGWKETNSFFFIVQGLTKGLFNNIHRRNSANGRYLTAGLYIMCLRSDWLNVEQSKPQAPYLSFSYVPTLSFWIRIRNLQEYLHRPALYPTTRTHNPSWCSFSRDILQPKSGSYSQYVYASSSKTMA
jgi:hypothetical protein